MGSPRARHLRGADDVAPWVAGSQIAWDLMARRHAPFTPRLQDNDDGARSHGGEIDPADNPFAMLRELLDRMPAAPPPPPRQEAQADGAHMMPVAVAVSDTGAYIDDAYRNGGFGAVPASSEAIAGLRVTSAGEARERGCTVCLQDFGGGDKLRTMPCLHSFHERCIFGWLRVSGACPLCRHRLPTERQ